MAADTPCGHPCAYCTLHTASPEAGSGATCRVPAGAAGATRSSHMQGMHAQCATCETQGAPRGPRSVEECREGQVLCISGRQAEEAGEAERAAGEESGVEMRRRRRHTSS
jgi:hypothetical protein